MSSLYPQAWRPKYYVSTLFLLFKLQPSQLWNNIRSLVLVPTKCNTPNISVVGLNKSFIYGPIDTPVHLPLPLLKPSAFKLACNSETLPLLYRIKSNSTERYLVIPPLVLKKDAKQLCSFVTDTINSSLSQGILSSPWKGIHSTPLPNHLMHRTTFGQ